MTTAIRSDPAQSVVNVNGVDQLFIKDDGKATVRTAGTTGLEVATAGQALGIGQTWQNMTASRALGGTVYTNTTGKPIYVWVEGSSTSVTSAQLTIGTIVIRSNGQNTAGYNMGVGGIVPPNTAYSANIPAGTLTMWAELRT